jgi:hypothetical protein
MTYRSWTPYLSPQSPHAGSSFTTALPTAQRKDRGHEVGEDAADGEAEPTLHGRIASVGAAVDKARALAQEEVEVAAPVGLHDVVVE